mmetsp:Transcript_55341/g.171716  ORF Transcript_55341/g.171716 Transcript_55341/m.171716 type:complete len:99 (+) Transcript_55341:89-385(+)
MELDQLRRHKHRRSRDEIAPTNEDSATTPAGKLMVHRSMRLDPAEGFVPREHVTSGLYHGDAFSRLYWFCFGNRLTEGIQLGGSPGSLRATACLLGHL